MIINNINKILHMLYKLSEERSSITSSSQKRKKKDMIYSPVKGR